MTDADNNHIDVRKHGARWRSSPDNEDNDFYLLTSLHKSLHKGSPRFLDSASGAPLIVDSYKHKRLEIRFYLRTSLIRLA